MTDTEIVVTAMTGNHGTLLEFEGLDPENFPVRFFADHRMGWDIAEALEAAEEDVIALVPDYLLYATGGPRPTQLHQPGGRHERELRS